MNRRRLLKSAIPLAGGLATTIGSGAFSSVQAERSVEVAVVDDDQAYLRLEAKDSTGSVRAEDSTGQLRFFIPGLNSQADGTGVAPNSVHIFDPLVRVENLGDDPVELFSETPSSIPDQFDRISLTVSGDPVDSEADAVELSTGGSISCGLLIETAPDASVTDDRIKSSIKIRADPPGNSDTDEGR